MSNTDRYLYFRSSMSIITSKLPWSLETHILLNIGFYPYNIHVTYPIIIQKLRYYNKSCPTLSLDYNFLSYLATLYTQSRPIMLFRQCIAATAGTFLVRNSQTKINHNSILWLDFTVKPSLSSTRKR